MRRAGMPPRRYSAWSARHEAQGAFPHGGLRDPFHPRTSQLNLLNEWHRWKDYTTADAYFDEALEYSAIRNACAVFDLTR